MIRIDRENKTKAEHKMDREVKRAIFRLRPRIILNEKEKRKRIILTVGIGILLSLLYVVIFSFSAQDAETSTGVSMEVTEKGIDMLTGLTGFRFQTLIEAETVERMEHIVRKLAHFTEYAVMGMLVCMGLGLWYERGRCRFLLNVGWVSVSAAFDELHQLFVAGRYASVRDVLLDTAGGAFGIWLVWLGVWITVKAFRKRQGKRLQDKTE